MQPHLPIPRPELAEERVEKQHEKQKPHEPRVGRYQKKLDYCSYKKCDEHLLYNPGVEKPVEHDEI